nr:hypothetical protein [Lachnospiraceae bacterium]
MSKVISRVKEALLKMNIWEYGALLLFLFNISVVVYFNLSDLRLSLDPDFAITVYHMREMVNKGTPVLQDFCITTSMEYDNTILFAAPLYAMTHNAFLSVGISNLILVALYIFAIRNIFIAFKVKPGIQFLTLAAIFTPYAFGWLDYFKMLFCAHANYGVKALIPIMLILCMIAYDNRLFKDSFPRWKRIVFIVLYLFLLFVTCVSSGTYTIICGILPVLMIVVIAWWRKLPERKGLSKPTLVSRYTVWAGTIIASITGLLLYKKVYTGGSKIAPLVKFEDFDFNFRAVLVGFFQIFGGLTSEELPAFSMMGIFFCLKICLAAIFMIIMFVIIVRFVKERGNYEQYMLFGVTLPVNMLILMI